MRRTILALLLLAACGRIAEQSPDPDAVIDAPDASPPQPAPVRAARDLGVAAGHLAGGTLTVDVQLGAIDQSRITGGVFTATTAAPLNP